MARQAGSGQPQRHNELVAAYLEVPVMTRVLVTATVVLSLVTHLKFIGYEHVMLIWDDVFKSFHIWKLVTSFFLHPVGFGFLFELVFLFRNSRYLETETYLAKPGDYLYYFIITGLTCLVGANILELTVLGDTLVYLVTTLWSLYNPEQIVSFFFGFQFKGKYLPWVQVAITYILSVQLPKAALLGIFASYAFFYVKTALASSRGIDYLETPAFITRLFPQGSRTAARPEGFVATAPRNTESSSSGSTGGGYNWGKGRRLGD